MICLIFPKTLCNCKHLFTPLHHMWTHFWQFVQSFKFTTRLFTIILYSACSVAAEHYFCCAADNVFWSSSAILIEILIIMMFLQEIVDPKLSARVEELLTPIGIHVSLYVRVLQSYCLYMLMLNVTVRFALLCEYAVLSCFFKSNTLDVYYKTIKSLDILSPSKCVDL